MQLFLPVTLSEVERVYTRFFTTFRMTGEVCHPERSVSELERVSKGSENPLYKNENTRLATAKRVHFFTLCKRKKLTLRPLLHLRRLRLDPCLICGSYSDEYPLHNQQS